MSGRSRFFFRLPASSGDAWSFAPGGFLCAFLPWSQLGAATSFSTAALSDPGRGGQSVSRRPVAVGDGFLLARD